MKDIRLWFIYSICSAPFEPNPDWYQLLVIILFAPHPFYAAISPSIPSYSAASPNVTLIHPPSLKLRLWDFRYSVCRNYRVGRNQECQWEQRDFLCSLYLIPVPHFLYHTPPLSLSLPPSPRRPQITTSLRVWSVAGVLHWCWVKVEWFTKREICRLSRAPGDLFPANNSQTTLISALNAGIRYSTHLHYSYVITTVLCIKIFSVVLFEYVYFFINWLQRAFLNTKHQ